MRIIRHLDKSYFAQIFNIEMITGLLDRYGFALLGFAMLLIRLPPFYIFLVKTPVLNSYNVAGYICFILVSLRMVSGFFGRQKTVFKSPHLVAIGIFFLSQTLSVINAVNIREFIPRYKDLVFAVLLYLAATYEIKSRRDLYRAINILMFATVANLAIQVVLYFQIPLSKIVSFFFTEGYVKDFEINANRDRFFVDSYEAAMIPIMLLLFDKTKTTSRKLFLAATGVIIIVNSFLSNFRAQLVVLFVSLVAGGVVYFGKIGRFLKMLPIILLVLYLVNFITANGFGYNAFDRLVAPESGDYVTVTDRFYYWRLATDMGLSSPVFGVGLGNFFDYLPGNKNVNMSIFDARNDFFKITWVHPHNLFFGTLAETGFFGLAALSIMLLLFAQSDLKAFFANKDRQLNYLIVSFWLIFAFSLVNAPISLSYLGLFWLMRGLIAVAALKDG